MGAGSRQEETCRRQGVDGSREQTGGDMQETQGVDGSREQTGGGMQETQGVDRSREQTGGYMQETESRWDFFLGASSVLTKVVSYISEI